MHHLALQLGKTVKQLSGELTFKEMLDWSEYFRRRESPEDEETDWSDPAQVAKVFNT